MGEERVVEIGTVSSDSEDGVYERHGESALLCSETKCDEHVIFMH